MAFSAQGELPPTDALLDVKFPTHSHTYTPRDCCLYALGVGCGAADLRCVIPRRTPYSFPAAAAASHLTSQPRDHQPNQSSPHRPPPPRPNNPPPRTTKVRLRVRRGLCPPPHLFHRPGAPRALRRPPPKLHPRLRHFEGPPRGAVHRAAVGQAAGRGAGGQHHPGAGRAVQGQGRRLRGEWTFSPGAVVALGRSNVALTRPHQV
jgi:hypothetical protein